MNTTLFRVVKHVVIAEVKDGGDSHPIWAAFSAIGDDYATSYDNRPNDEPMAATYEFPGPVEGSTISIDVSDLRKDDLPNKVTKATKGTRR